MSATVWIVSFLTVRRTTGCARATWIRPGLDKLGYEKPIHGIVRQDATCIENRSLSNKAKMLYAKMLLQRWRWGKCNLTSWQMADLAQASERTVRRLVAELEEHIPAKLRVKRGVHGSRARFAV